MVPLLHNFSAVEYISAENINIWCKFSIMIKQICNRTVPSIGAILDELIGSNISTKKTSYLKPNLQILKTLTKILVETY